MLFINTLFKKTLAVSATAMLTLIFAACAATTPTDRDDKNLITAWGTEPQKPLLPGETNENGGFKNIHSLFAGLVYYDAYGETRNDMAESIELEGDRIYKIKLRNATFGDGTPVRASNFVLAWNYLIKHKQALSSLFKPIKGYDATGSRSLEGVKIINEKTFTIELSEPLSNFPDRLGHQAFYPLPDSAFEDMDAFGEHPIGNGPYAFASWNHNQDITLVANDSYSGPRRAQNNGVKFVVYPDIDAAYKDLLVGRLDVLETVPLSAFSTFEAELGDRAINKPTAVNQCLMIP